MSSSVDAPLRIGVIGASRIAELAIVDASERTKDVRAAVASRSAERAQAFADKHNFELAYTSYEELLEDKSLDLIYIGLPNALHAEWTVRALEAGHNVLLEKPFASNLAEFDRVEKQLRASTGWVWEAFHQTHHPVMQRFIELLRAGTVGEIRKITIQMDSPMPAEEDPRWSFDLSGGALMDVGCYALYALEIIADLLGAEARLLEADYTASATDKRVEAAVQAEFEIDKIPVHLHTSMLNDVFDFRLQVEGELGTLIAPGFARPFEDDRIIVEIDGASRVEHMGLETSYFYQLEAMRDLVRNGDRSASELSQSRRVMKRIDEVYRACGLPLRPSRYVGED